MVWSNEIAKAYQAGLEDGKKGRRARVHKVFSAAYAEGYLHGLNQFQATLTYR